MTTPSSDQPTRPPFKPVAPGGDAPSSPPPPPQSKPWPESPAPRPAPFAFPAAGRPASPPPGSPEAPPPPTPPTPAPAQPPSSTDEAATGKKAKASKKPKTEKQPKADKKRGRAAKKSSGAESAAPASSSTSKESGGKRGLFGIPWLGGKKSGGTPPPPPPDGPDDEPPTGWGGFFERASVLIVLGIFALVGVSSGVYLMFFRPEPVVLGPHEVHMVPLPTPTFEPSTPPGESAFAAALPTADLTYGLRSAEQNAWSPIKAWPTRAAEEWLLTYDDGAGNTMTVQAVQHYTAEMAKTAYDALLAQAQEEIAAAAASPSPSASPSAVPSATEASGIRIGVVRVDDKQVGQSFQVVKDVVETTTDPVTGEDTETTRRVAVVTWQNGTAVFVMTADPDAIDTLFIEYGF